MEDISFDDQAEFRRPIPETQSPTIVRFVLSLGLAKTKKQAEYILLYATIVMLGVAFAIPYLFEKKPITQPHAGSTSTYTGPISR